MYPIQDQQNGLRFEADAFLGLIVKGPVQATDIEVDSHHPFCYGAGGILPSSSPTVKRWSSGPRKVQNENLIYK